MMTVLYGERQTDVLTATVAGDDLWLPQAALPSATGWELKPEGLCRGDLCVPLPRGREGEFVAGGAVDVSAVARLLDLPQARSADGTVWAFGESGAARREALASLAAPDFTLPDLDGRMHALADYRGKKVFLVSWASW